MTKSLNAFKAMEVRSIVVLAIIAMACTFMTSCDNNTEIIDDYDSIFNVKKTCSITLSVKGITNENTRSALDALEFVGCQKPKGWTIEMTHLYTEETLFFNGDDYFNEFSTRVPRGPWSITLTIGPKYTDEDVTFSSDKSLVIEEEILIDQDETFEFKPKAACAAIAWDLDDIVDIFYETPNSTLIDVPYRLVGDGAYGLCFVWINPDLYPHGTLVKLWGLDYRGEYRRIEIDYTENGYFYPIETSYNISSKMLTEDWRIGGYSFYWKSGF